MSQDRDTRDWDTVLSVRGAHTQVAFLGAPYAWWGYYGRGQYNLGNDAVQATAGLGAGFFGLGLEAGALGQKEGENYDFGGEFTALFSVGYLGLFSRLTLFAEQPKAAEFGIRLNYLFIGDDK